MTEKEWLRSLLKLAETSDEVWGKPFMVMLGNIFAAEYDDPITLYQYSKTRNFSAKEITNYAAKKLGIEL